MSSTVEFTLDAKEPNCPGPDERKSNIGPPNHCLLIVKDGIDKDAFP